jgi:peptide deformylase
MMKMMQRPTIVKIKAQDVNGKTVKYTIEGWAARIFQHEYDHLQGVLFPDRMNLEHLERERDKFLHLEQDFSKRHPGVDFTSILTRLH